MSRSLQREECQLQGAEIKNEIRGHGKKKVKEVRDKRVG